MVAEHAEKEEDRQGTLQLRGKLTKLMGLPLFQDDKRDQHAGLTMALLVLKAAAHPSAEFHKARLVKVLRHEITARDTFAPETCIRKTVASKHWIEIQRQGSP